MTTPPEAGRDAEVFAFPSRPAPDAAGGAPVEDAPGFRDLVGQVLREERLHQERTLADVARDAAVSIQYLSEVERGRKDVSSDLLGAVHDALGLDLAEVLVRVVERLPARSQGTGLQMLAA